MALKTNFEDANFISSPFVDEVANRGLTSAKAKKILRDSEIRGKSLTKAQKGFFGARAGNSDVTGDSPSLIVAKNKARKRIRKFLDERGTKAKK